MARPRRIWIPEHFHHVVSRGNWRDCLFRDDMDFLSFLNILSYIHKTIDFEISSYCLMTNHYHLLLRTEKVALSTVMARVNKAYADYYHRRYHLTGHLFEKRFFSKPICDPLGILEVSRYIHMNPVEAEMTAQPSDYKWSSYIFYQFPSYKTPNFFNPSTLTDFFPGKTVNQKKRSYCRWLQTNS